MARAEEIMLRQNPNVLIGDEGEFAIFLEDVSDPDGRLYRMEYQSSRDGRHAVAFCRYNPWGPDSGLAGAGHCFGDGLLCMGSAHTASPAQSSYNLQTVIQRARYWCTAFSVLAETGEFPQP